MTRKDLIRETARRAGMTQWQAELAITAALEAVTDALATGDTIRLKRFGCLEVRRRKARQARNFVTGEPITKPAFYTVAFSPAADLKQAVNDNAAASDE